MRYRLAQDVNLTRKKQQEIQMAVALWLQRYPTILTTIRPEPMYGLEYRETN
jgi:hypothetical protein